MLCWILSSIAWSIGRIEIGGKMRKVHFTYWLTLFLMYFYSTPFWGRVYKWKFCLYVHLFVCLSSLLILFLFQTLSSRNITQSTLITQPLPRYPMSPIHVSHARQSTGSPSQSTGPPMNRIIAQTFFHLELCVN